MTQPELSIVIPFLNEKRVLPLLRERFENIAKRSDFWELIFVSDGSTDGSTEYVEAWSRVNPAVKLVVLTRNFGDRKSTRLNSSHLVISYAVFCLKKKNKTI